MQAHRIIKTITSDRLPELIDYKGMNVEIIILSESAQTHPDELKPPITSLRGLLQSKTDGMEFQTRVRNEWNRE
jgi:hypothetical protein